MPLSADPYAAKKFAEINGRRMACIDAGRAAPAIVFQHGNPTSSYLWRNVMPHCEGLGRLVACDLIGMGDSDKLAHLRPRPLHLRRAAPTTCSRCGTSSRSAHRIILVMHDWGSALGFEWARKQSRSRRRHRLHGSHRHAGHLGRLAGERAPRLPGLPLRGRRGHGARQEHVRRAHPAGLRHAQDVGRGDGRIPPPLRQPGRGPPPHAHLAAPDPHRGPAGRRRGRGRGLFGLARQAATCRSSSSMPTPARSWSAASARSAAPGRTRPRSPSKACTSSRRTAPTTSAAPSPTSCDGCGAISHEVEANQRPMTSMTKAG